MPAVAAAAAPVVAAGALRFCTAPTMDISACPAVSLNRHRSDPQIPHRSDCLSTGWHLGSDSPTVRHVLIHPSGRPPYLPGCGRDVVAGNPKAASVLAVDLVA